MSLQRFSTFQGGSSANPSALVASDDSKLLGHALLGLSQANHQHSQSIGDLANLKIRSPPTPLSSSDRQSSGNTNNVSSNGDMGGAIPPLQHKKGARSSIVAGGGQIAGNLAPLGLSSKSDNNAASASGSGTTIGGNPGTAFAAASAAPGTGKPRPPAVLASFRDSFEQQPGSPAPASSPAYDMSSTPERGPANATTTSSSKLVPNPSNSIRALSPLVRNNLPAVNSPLSQQAPLQSQQQNQPLGQIQQVSPQQPAHTLASKSSSHPSATAGIIVNLQVGAQSFLTTPETLLRYQQLEGTPNITSKGASSSAADSASTPSCTPLLVWIAEEALSKLTANSPTTTMAPTAESPIIISGASSSLRPPSLSPATLPTRSHSIPTSTEPSPRGPTATVGLGTGPFGHAASQFHSQNGFSSTMASAPHTAYALFIDRNPLGFGPLLDYLRDGASMFRATILPNLTEPVLAALLVEAEFFSCAVLSSLVSTEINKRNQNRNLNPDDLFWREVMEKLDQLYPEENQTLVEAISSTAKLQRNLGSMLRRLAFQRDPMLRVCHATYSHTNEYQERLLEILWTTCTLCQRQIFFKAIGRREGRESGCPVHPANGQWDRKNRMWTCCGSPEFKNSGCETTGIHYTQWSFWSAME